MTVLATTSAASCARAEAVKRGDPNGLQSADSVGGLIRPHRRSGRAPRGEGAREVAMCFVHSGTVRHGNLIQQASVGSGAAALSGLAAGEGGIGGMDVAGAGSADVTAGPSGDNVVDGYGRVLHNRWNRDLPPAATVRPGEVVQLLCRDALDIGEAARTMTPDGTLTIDLGLVHPL